MLQYTTASNLTSQVFAHPIHHLKQSYLEFQWGSLLYKHLPCLKIMITDILYNVIAMITHLDQPTLLYCTMFFFSSSCCTSQTVTIML